MRRSGVFQHPVSSFGIFLGGDSDPQQFYIGYGGTNYLSPGLYQLGTLAVSIASDNPDIVFGSSVGYDPYGLTGFGSQCSGNDLDFTMQLGTDWFDSDGVGSLSRWVPSGFALAHSTTHPSVAPVVGTDEAGNAIVAWIDQVALPFEIYAQRVTNQGLITWLPGGILVASRALWVPAVVQDGAGGAVFAWCDNRAGTYDVYAQRFDSTGTAQWAAGGVPVCTASGDQGGAQAVSDGSGGVIVAWSDERGAALRVFAQRVSGTGSPLWATDGIPLAAGANGQGGVGIVSDGAGGAIICWPDTRNDPTTTDIYAQRVSSSGLLLWTSAGAAVVTNPFSQDDPAIVADRSGGVIILWRDSRSGSFDVYAQRMDASGSPLWASDGVVVSNAVGDQVYPVAAESEGGGAIAFWLDCRSDPQAWDVYA